MSERRIPDLSPLLSLNCSMVLGHLPVHEQPAVAAAAGFRTIELWWPFDGPVAPPAEADRLVDAVASAGVRVALLNVFGGDLAAGERGLASIPGRAGEFADGVESVVELGGRLGVRAVNPMYGNRVPGHSAREQDELGEHNLVHAARAVARIGARLALEPLSGVADYPLRTAESALVVVDRVRAAGGPATGLLADLYHLSLGGEDVGAVIDRHAADVVHVQIADAPGRGRPGTGELPLRAWVRRCRDAGYRGPVGLEYVPSTPDEGFDWIGGQFD